MVNNDILVSVCVITYNSSKYVLETLDSIYNQTYHNIELIVSDDCSKDETIPLVEQWLINKRSRFENVQVLTVDDNTGTAANCNRGLVACNGEWIKFIAGDDVLFHDAIEKYVDFLIKKDNVEWFLAKAICYRSHISEDCIISPPRKGIYKEFKNLNQWTSNEQFKKMYLTNFLSCPTHFFKRQLLERVGGYKEKWSILEDYPMWLTLLRSGVKCFFLDEYVVGYRYGDSNVSANSGRILNKRMKTLEFKTKKEYLFDRCPPIVKCHAYITFMINMLFAFPFLNSKTDLRYVVYRILISLTNSLTKKFI